jgi:hypothetical protein
MSGNSHLSIMGRESSGSQLRKPASCFCQCAGPEISLNFTHCEPDYTRFAQVSGRLESPVDQGCDFGKPLFGPAISAAGAKLSETADLRTAVFWAIRHKRCLKTPHPKS